MDTLSTFGDNITHYKTESVHFWGLMNSATRLRFVVLLRERLGLSSGLGSKGFQPIPLGLMLRFGV